MSAGHKEIESPVGKVGSGAQALPKQSIRSAGRDPNRLEPQRDTVSDDNCSVAATSSYLLTRWWRLLSSGRPSHPLPAEASPPPLPPPASSPCFRVAPQNMCPTSSFASCIPVETSGSATSATSAASAACTDSQRRHTAFSCTCIYVERGASRDVRRARCDM